jgi:coproporphyrinogen III oxidase
VERVRAYLMDLQDRITAGIQGLDGAARFREDPWTDGRGGFGRPRVLEGGVVFEKAAAHVTHAIGERLPPAATESRPQLAGRGFEAASLSVICHPRNPYAPTTHLNLRCFASPPGGLVPESPSKESLWWFGGGFDLTPYYGFEDDAVAWHTAARDACRPFGEDVYARFKAACDRYFFLPHRNEPRGIGGVFFDDLSTWGFARTFALARAVGEAFLPAYLGIVTRRKDTPYGERERAFQLLRRGRYVEFNLLYDRGTRYGLELGRRADLFLASLPPLVRWPADPSVEPGSPEAELLSRFLVPRDWV